MKPYLNVQYRANAMLSFLQNQPIFIDEYV